jgi:hypothetical protein
MWKTDMTPIGEGTAYVFVAVEDVNFAALPETSIGHRASVPIP